MSTAQPVIPRPVPLHYFGKDHWSTFGYAASVATGERMIDKDKMRTDNDRHPHGVGFREMAFHVTSGPQARKYPTRLREGVELSDHDDWDCLDDLVASGLLTWGTWVNPWVVLTDLGLSAFAQLKAYENDPATARSWSRLMQSWVPPIANSGMAEAGDRLHLALEGASQGEWRG